MKKRVLSLALALLLTVSIIPFTGIITLASDPPKITEAELQAKFATLRSKLENKYFTVNQTYCVKAPGESGHPPKNDCSNCKNTNVYNASWFPLMTPQDHPENMPKHYCPGGGYITSVAWSCAGFATYAQWYLHASQPGDYVVSEKKGGDISLSYNNLKSVGAHVGDVIRTSGGHSIVLYSYDQNGISYIQCNGTKNDYGNCKVTYHSGISYSNFSSRFGGTVCVTGCKNFSSTSTTYTISYNANGGTGAPVAQTKSSSSNLTLSSTKPTRTGYTFLGWATSSTATSAAYQPGGTFTTNANTTLYAVWKANVLTVNFNTGGGTVGKSTYGYTADSSGLLSGHNTVEYGKTFGQYGITDVDSDAFDLSKKGYHLEAGKEWRAENGALLSQSDNTYTAEQVASICGKDLTKGNVTVTLTANWIIDTYTIKYDANGGTGTPAPQTKTHGTNLALSTTTPTRSGYAFQGWATSASATSANYQPGATYSNNANVTLYAVWKGCTVWSDWSTTKPSSGEYESRTEYRYKDNQIIKNGSSSVTGYTQSAKTKIGSTSYSAWTAIKPTVSNSSDSSYSYERSLETKTAYQYSTWYNSSSYNYFWYNHSNVGSPRYLNVYTDKSVSSNLADDGHKYLSSTGSTKLTTGATDSVIGYIYVMYDYDDSGSGYPQNGKTITSFTSKASTLPLYIGDTSPAFSGTTAPVYRIATDTYQYTHYKWGDWSSWSTNAVSANDNRQVETRTVYRYKVATQHTFGGWTKTKDETCTSTGTQTRKCSVCGTTETGSIPALGHSYGSWVNDTEAGVRRRTCSRCSNVETETYFYNVSYNANGGSDAPATQIKTKNTNLTLSSTTPTRAGYAFQGWATSASATSVAYQPGGSYNSNAAVTLYAVWKANTYRIEYNLDGGSFEHEPGGMYEWDKSSGAHIIQQKNPLITCYGGYYNGSNIDAFTIEKPIKEGYIFDGWEIAGMDNSTHYYWDNATSQNISFNSTSFTLLGSKAFDLRNLRSTDGLVTFTAKWHSAHTHNYTSEITTKATCTTDGIKTFTCLCGDSYTETIKATGHKNTVRITEKKPTCLEKGSEDEYCLDCSELVGTYEIPALGHDNSGEWVTEKSATCTEKGSKVLYCKRCNVKIDTKEIAALGHNFVFVEKNENHPHNELFKCTRCRETKTTDSVYSATCPECNFTSTATDNNSCKITGYTGNLKKITIPATLNGKKVTSTNTGALKANSVITEVTIEDGVSEIGSLTFMNCTNLEKVIVPESVTTIGSMPFYGCADGFKVYCYRGSFAQEYCETNSIDYVIIDIAAQKGTEIDYENKLIFTQKENCLNILDLLKIPSTSIAVPTESFSSYIGSGSTVTVFENGDFTGDYKVIVYGDLDGDSVCDVFDIVMAERIFSKNTTASKEQIYAANGCVSEEIDVMSYQNVVNSALS